jgi:flagellar P-ring protein precursor FlgI
VTADVSLYLRPGARFEVQVSSLGDATSLRGGNLVMTPLMTDVGAMPVATAQGPVILSEEPGARLRNRGGTSGRVPRGGVLEVAFERPETSAQPILLLTNPNVTMAQRITAAINTSLGDGSAELVDPGAVRLTPTGGAADNVFEFVSTVVNLNVSNETRRVVIDLQDGTVVAGGGLLVGAAAVTHSGITVSIGDSTAAPGGEALPGLLRVGAETTVQAVAEGLHATGARPREIAAIFGALREVGALTAEVVVR